VNTPDASRPSSSIVSVVARAPPPPPPSPPPPSRARARAMRRPRADDARDVPVGAGRRSARDGASVRAGRVMGASTVAARGADAPMASTREACGDADARVRHPRQGAVAEAVDT